MANKEFENLLDVCLERLLSGESVEQCIEQFPEQARELRPLLELASMIKATSAIQPSQEFRAKARFELQSVLKGKYKDRSTLTRMPRWVTVSSLIMGLLLLFSGAIITSANSMPESPLYAIKLLTERVNLTMTLDSVQKAQYQSELADRRISEIVYLADKGNTEFMELTNRRFEEQLAALALLIPTIPSSDINVPGQPLSMMAAEPSEGAATVTERAIDEEAESDIEVEKSGLEASLQQDAIENEATIRACIADAPLNIKEVLRTTLNISITGYAEIMQAFS